MFFVSVSDIMGVGDLFMLNGNLNWDPISTICTTILTAVLIGVTWWYAAQIEKRAKDDRLQKEMDLLVSPLYSKSHSELKIIFFMRGSSGNYDNKGNREMAYFQFWDNIRRYKYLGSKNLQSALDSYLNNKSQTVGDRSRDSAYVESEKKLFEEIDKRYSELQEEL